jgi:chromosome segregation ATPase
MMLCSPILMNRLLEEMSRLRCQLKGIQDHVYESWDIIETLREENKRYRDVLTALPQPFFIKDESLCYLLCSVRFASDLNKTVDEIIGKVDEDLVPVELANMRRQQEMRVLESCQAEEVEEILIIDGQTKVFMTMRAPLKNADGRISGIFGVSVDISSYWRKMVELSNLNRQMENLLAGQSQQIESLQSHLEQAESGMKQQGEKFSDLRLDYEKQLSLQNVELARLKNELQRHPAERDEMIQTLQRKFRELQNFVDGAQKYMDRLQKTSVDEGPSVLKSEVILFRKPGN